LPAPVCARRSAARSWSRTTWDAAALAEQAHGHGRHLSSFAFVTVGTGIGNGTGAGTWHLHRGGARRRGARSRSCRWPWTRSWTMSSTRRRRSAGAASRPRCPAAAVTRGRPAGRHAGLHLGPQGVRGRRAGRRAGRCRWVAAEAVLVAKAICAVGRGDRPGVGPCSAAASARRPASPERGLTEALKATGADRARGPGSARWARTRWSTVCLAAGL